MQQRADLLHEIVAGCAITTPLVGQFLAAEKNFLYDDIGASVLCGCRSLRRELFEALPQRAAVGCWVRQPIDMVDAHAVNNAIGVKPENQCVNAFECLRVLHAQADQLVDVEEAAPVDLVIRDAPPRQTVMLTPKQLVQALPAI